MLSDAADMRDEILQGMVRRDLVKARSIIQTQGALSAPQLLTALTASGLRPETARRILALPEFKR